MAAIERGGRAGGAAEQRVAARNWSAAEAGAAGAPVDVVHLDMDAFFAAVEVLENPSLAGRPLVVGGTGDRGVVASASYEARRFGIHAAMPTAQARRLCPDAVFVRGRYERYSELSGRLLELLRQTTPLVEPIALDEAYLDVSGAHGRSGPSEAIAWGLRGAVEEQLLLSCSVGVGRTKLVAKLASEAAKPQMTASGPVPGLRVCVVRPEEESAFLARHPVRAIPGVGPRTAERLARFGVASVADLALVSRESLIRLLGAAHGGAVYDLARGRDPRVVEPDRPLRSIGHEETFERDDRDLASLQSKAKTMALAVTSRCRAEGWTSRTIGVKVRFGDFSTVTRVRTLDYPVTTGAEVGEVAGELLAQLDCRRGVRLLGVQLSGLAPLEERNHRQLELFGAGGENEGAEGRSPAELERREELEAATDEIRRRFGAGALDSLAAASRRQEEGLLGPPHGLGRPPSSS